MFIHPYCIYNLFRESEDHVKDITLKVDTLIFILSKLPTFLASLK